MCIEIWKFVNICKYIHIYISESQFPFKKTYATSQNAHEAKNYNLPNKKIMALVKVDKVFSMRHQLFSACNRPIQKNAWGFWVCHVVWEKVETAKKLNT